MANHAAATLLIASLLVAVVLADARVAVQVQRDIVRGICSSTPTISTLIGSSLTLIGTCVAVVELQVMLR
jgi:hypothetical protein